jgi:DNA-binding NtrC family response regulator
MMYERREDLHRMTAACITSVTLPEMRTTIETDLGPPQPHLFRVLECNFPLAPSARYCLVDVESVAIGRGERRCDPASRGRQQLHLRVPDPWMSSAHARLFHRNGSWVVEDAGSRNGTMVNGAAVERADLADADIIELGHTFFVFREGLARSVAEPDDLESAMLSPVVAELTSLNPLLARQVRKLVQVSSTDVSVVVQGDTGTGKEQIARAVHVLSHRGGEFVAVNCGALPHTLIETELFGCRRGAFTGAQDRPGLIRTADRGTLFLDEVSDLPPAAQAALLRVLQERQVHAVGATHPVPVDFRLVCASQEPLDLLVQNGRFRADLYARLAGFTVHLPPLRERREDLGIIIANLIRRLVPERADRVTFDKDAARALLRSRFPLNIRELQKCLEGALALAGDRPIQLAHLSLDAEHQPAPSRRAGSVPPAVLEPRDIELKQQLIALLELHRGNVSATARAMVKDRVQIRRWLRRYAIDPARFRH